MCKMKSLIETPVYMALLSKIREFENSNFKFFRNEPEAYLNFVQTTYGKEIEFVYQVERLRVCISELEKMNESFFRLLKDANFKRITFYKRFEAKTKINEYVSFVENYLYDRYVLGGLFPSENYSKEVFLDKMYKKNRLRPREWIYTPTELLPMPF